MGCVAQQFIQADAASRPGLMQTSGVNIEIGSLLFTPKAENSAQWIEVGRCYERFALQSAALGIRNAMLDQPVEVSALRPQFATFLGVGGRRPVDAVLT